MLDSIFEPGVTGNPRALLWAFATFMAWIIFFPLYWFKNMRGRES